MCQGSLTGRQICPSCQVEAGQMVSARGRTALPNDDLIGSNSHPSLSLCHSAIRATPGRLRSLSCCMLCFNQDLVPLCPLGRFH